MGDRPAARALFLVALAASVAAAAMVSCGESPSGSAQRTFTSTVTLGDQIRVIVDSPVSLVVKGSPVRREVVATVNVTVTASSAERAKVIADELELVAEPIASSRELKLTLTGVAPFQAGLSGELVLEMPNEMALSAIVRGGTGRIESVEGAIEVTAISSVRITGAKDKAIVKINSGNAIIDSFAPPGSQIQADVGTGDIELDLPPTVSADIEATIGQQGAGRVLVDHPALPQPVGPGVTNYKQRVNGGLALVRVLARAGNIVIRARR